jgi:hypothetical protein
VAADQQRAAAGIALAVVTSRASSLVTSSIVQS